MQILFSTKALGRDWDTHSFLQSAVGFTHPSHMVSIGLEKDRHITRSLLGSLVNVQVTPEIMK
jgi:hypothetical protein